MIAALLTLIIGVGLGWYAERMYAYVIDTRDRLQYAKEFKDAGVVRPGRVPANSSTAPGIVDLGSDTGGVRRPSVDKHIIAQHKEREERVKNL